MNEQIEAKKTRNAKEKKKQNLKTMLGIFAALCLITILAIFIYILAEDDVENHDRAIEYCTNQGYSKMYCEKGFGF